MSHISQTAEYALRAMSRLALATPDETVAAATISRLADVPQHYLSKVLRKLVAAKLVLAVKGPGGGFRLARPPDAIRFLDIMTAVGENTEPDRCAFGWGRCNPKAQCPMHPAFTKLNDDIWQWATNTTLAAIRRPDEKRAAEMSRRLEGPSRPRRKPPRAAT